mmetsp:Transcript_4018/g.6658  ORF Transcript_4018/g.6658 Transcript_4018/m.6658 type:complete len:433 (+) Transcript_4018:50-1348(+)
MEEERPASSSALSKGSPGSASRLSRKLSYGSFIADQRSRPGFRASSGLHTLLGIDAPLVVLVILLFSLPLCTFGLQGEGIVSVLALAYGVILSLMILAMSYGRPWRWALYSVGCLISSLLGAVLGLSLRSRVPGYKNGPTVLAFIVGYSVLCFLLQAFMLHCGYHLRGSSEEFREENGWGWNEEAAVHMLYGVDDTGTAGFELIADKKYPTFLAEGLLKQRACWSGEPAPDYIFHLSNDHMFIGCLLCHPANPFDRKERFLTLVILFLLIIFPVAVFTVAISNPIARTIVILMAVTIPRGVLKLFLKEVVLVRDEEILKVVEDENLPLSARRRDSIAEKEEVLSAETSQTLFFIKCYLFAAVVVAGSCVYLMVRDELTGQLLLDSCTGIVYFIVLEFHMHLLCPYFTEDGVQFGFFGHWWSQRYKHADDCDE